MKHQMTKYLSLLCLSGLSTLLLGCQEGIPGNTSTSTSSSSSSSSSTSSSSSSTSSTSSSGASVEYDAAKSPLNASGLTLASGATLQNHIANGMRVVLNKGSWEIYPAPHIDTYNPLVFSQPNTPTTNVEVADTAKYDGQHWYVISSLEDSRNGIHVMETDSDIPAIDFVQTYPPIADSFDGNLTGLYLLREEDDATSHLITIREKPGLFSAALPASHNNTFLSDGRFTDNDGDTRIRQPNGKTQIALLDLQDSNPANLEWSIELDGTLITSRKIDQYLHLITRYEAWSEELKVPYFGNTSIGIHNSQVFTDLELTDILPHYTIGSTHSPLSTDCFITNGLQSHHGLTSLIHITTLDLNTQTLVDSTCLNADLESLSIHSDAVYLTGSLLSETTPETVIYKLSLSGSGVQYEAAGSVAGILGTNIDPQFRMHSHEDQFRILTTQPGNHHSLHILEQQGSALSLIGALPNASNPTAIGKPNQGISAVQFDGNHAYVVTANDRYAQTSDLSVLDIANPNAPAIKSTLQVNHTISSLHPIDGRFLFSIGTGYRTEFPNASFIKMKLFDISGSSSIPVVSQLSYFENSRSLAFQNLKAMSWLPINEEEIRIALPVLREPFTNSSYDMSAVFVELKDLTTSPTVNLSGALNAIRTNSYTSMDFNDRVIIDGDTAFYTHRNTFWAAPWGSQNSATSPVTPN